MPLASTTARHLEYAMLMDAAPAGPVVGQYAGGDIAAAVTDAFGRRYDFVSLAPRDWKGRIDVRALEAGEFIVPPGLVYRLRVPRVRRTWLTHILSQN